MLNETISSDEDDYQSENEGLIGFMFETHLHPSAKTPAHTKLLHKKLHTRGRQRDRFCFDDDGEWRFGIATRNGVYSKINLGGMDKFTAGSPC